MLKSTVFVGVFHSPDIRTLSIKYNIWFLENHSDYAKLKIAFLETYKKMTFKIFHSPNLDLFDVSYQANSATV